MDIIILNIKTTTPHSPAQCKGYAAVVHGPLIDCRLVALTVSRILPLELGRLVADLSFVLSIY
jgi:hypothetical protein